MDHMSNTVLKVLEIKGKLYVFKFNKGVKICTQSLKEKNKQKEFEGQKLGTGMKSLKKNVASDLVLSTRRIYTLTKWKEMECSK